MLSALVAISFLAWAPAELSKTYELHPVADVWVYPHAGDPSKDPYLRVWGTRGRTVAGEQDDLSDFSYSYLKFDLAGAEGKLLEASLILTHVAEAEDGPVEKPPLEVRPVSADWDERTWQYDRASVVRPSAGASIFGSVAPKKIAPGEPYRLEIDLMKGPAKISEAIAGARYLGLALASSIDPQEVGMKGIYKFFSKDGDRDKRPVLRLKVMEE
jgi:hypothetical protein